MLLSNERWMNQFRDDSIIDQLGSKCSVRCTKRWNSVIKYPYLGKQNNRSRTLNQHEYTLSSSATIHRRVPSAIGVTMHTNQISNLASNFGQYAMLKDVADGVSLVQTKPTPLMWLHTWAAFQAHCFTLWPNPLHSYICILPLPLTTKFANKFSYPNSLVSLPAQPEIHPATTSLSSQHTRSNRPLSSLHLPQWSLNSLSRLHSTNASFSRVPQVKCCGAPALSHEIL